MNLPESVLVEQQKKDYGPVFYTEHGTKMRIVAHVRYDDDCGNGHNTFSITATIDEWRNGRWHDYSSGCCHDDVAKLFHDVAKGFPALAPLVKWHLVSSDGPMFYVANTLYWANDHQDKDFRPANLEYARSTAVWPDATLEQLRDKAALEARLPALMIEFKAAVESLGFVY